MIKKSGNLVLLPALNEGRFIASIIEKLSSFTCADILLIDDGSTDDTVYKASKAGVDNIISHSSNMGYGRALAEGFNYAVEKEYRKVVTMDCDAQHEPEMVEEFFENLVNFDIVSGSRYTEKSPRRTFVPGERFRINRIITEEINRVTSYRITDAFCGFKGYRVSALKALDITEAGYGMPLQLWIQAWRAGLKVREIPVALIYHTRESFPEDLKNPDQRLDYYKRIIENEKRKG